MEWGMTLFDLLSQNQVSQVLTLVLQAVQTVIVVVGVPFVVVQIRQQTKALRIQGESIMLSNYMELMTEASRISELLVEEPALDDFYDESKLPADLASGWGNLNEKYRRFYLYLGRCLSLMERAYVLWTRHWMDDADYLANSVQLRELMGLKIFRLWWKNLRPYYRPDFASYIDRLSTVSSSDADSFLAAALGKSGAKYP